MSRLEVRRYRTGEESELGSEVRSSRAVVGPSATRRARAFSGDMVSQKTKQQCNANFSDSSNAPTLHLLVCESLKQEDLIGKLADCARRLKLEFVKTLLHGSHHRRGTYSSGRSNLGQYEYASGRTEPSYAPQRRTL